MNSCMDHDITQGICAIFSSNDVIGKPEVVIVCFMHPPVKPLRRSTEHDSQNKMEKRKTVVLFPSSASSLGPTGINSDAL